MEDIRIVNNEIVKVQKVEFDIDRIENNISQMSYEGMGLIRDKKVENGKLPSIAKTFYEKIYTREIPSPKTLFNEYISENFEVKDSICIYNNVTYNLEGVRARVYRTYPSLLRDFHFYILCYNSNLFDMVEYSFLTDMTEGIDLTLTYKGEKFGVSLFVDTKRGNHYKNKKYKRHNYEKINEICLAINPFDKSNRIGEYSLYRTKHIDELMFQIDRILESTNIAS